MSKVGYQYKVLPNKTFLPCASLFSTRMWSHAFKAQRVHFRLKIHINVIYILKLYEFSSLNLDLSEYLSVCQGFIFPQQDQQCVTISVGAVLLLLFWSTWPFVLTARHVLRCHHGLALCSHPALLLDLSGGCLLPSCRLSAPPARLKPWK